jgi:Copper binding proteins, plastocyanin/azurin family
MTKVGDACTVRFPKANAYLFFCQVHYAQGMKAVITVRSGGGSGPTTTASAAGRTLPWSPHQRRRRPPRPAAGHLLGGLGLFAVGALLALMLLALYVRFHPRLQPPEALD